jgi:hypothetical protein
MGIQNWSESIVLVELSPEPEINEELKTVIKSSMTKAIIT